MKSILDSKVAELTCPHCSSKFSERLGKLKAHSEIACPHCRGVVAVDADQIRQTIQQIDKASADLLRKAGRAFK